MYKYIWVKELRICELQCSVFIQEHPCHFLQSLLGVIKQDESEVANNILLFSEVLFQAFVGSTLLRTYILCVHK